jgi:hypothetical protein
MSLFGLMFLAEVGDAFILLTTLAEPSPDFLRATIRLILAVLVASGALLALVGLLARKPTLYRQGALACVLGYLAYGLYQVTDGALQIGSGVVILAGFIYLILGGLSYAMYRSVS